MAIPVTTPRTTAELIVAARRGESDAFEEIILRHERHVWSAVRRYRLNHADAQDAVQITWLRLVENLDRLRDPDRLPGWLITTASRECLRISRRRLHEVADPEQRLTQQVADHAPSPEQHAVDHVMSRVLWKQVARLPARAQALLWTMTSHDAPRYTEVAQQMGMPVGSIGPTRGRYLRQLRRQLEQVGLPQSAWH